MSEENPEWLSQYNAYQASAVNFKPILDGPHGKANWLGGSSKMHFTKKNSKIVSIANVPKRFGRGMIFGLLPRFSEGRQGQALFFSNPNLFNFERCNQYLLLNIFQDALHTKFE